MLRSSSTHRCPNARATRLLVGWTLCAVTWCAVTWFDFHERTSPTAVAAEPAPRSAPAALPAPPPASTPASTPQNPMPPASEPLSSSEKLSEADKVRFQQRLKGRSNDDRVRALEELTSFAEDVEAARLILQFGLRDRLEKIHEAASAALLAARRNPEMGRFLVDQLRLEATSKKRPNVEYLQRLLAVVCQFRFPDVHQTLLRWAEESDAASQQLILDQLMGEIDRAAKEQDPTLVAILETLAKSRPYGRLYGFRRCIVDAAIRLRTAAAVAFLIEQLPSLEGELRHQIVRHLRGVAGSPLPADTETWKKWLQERRNGFQFPPAGADGVSLEEPGTASYYDLPIHAKRLVFILDTSKSMEAAEMITRLEAARRELHATIDQLPEQTLFNVIVFNTTVGVWQERMAPATERWKSLAKGFVTAQRPSGKTATYDALQAAFNADAGVEAIYLLSDGAPSAGAVIPPAMLLDAVRKLNRARRVTINTIGVFGGGDPEGLEPFMKKLADENYGQYRRAN